MNNLLSYEEITKDIMANRKFQRIAHESHHGITRMEHSQRVARNVYKLAVKLGLDYESATRAALIHDFFTNDEFLCIKGLGCGVIHPDIALANANQEFELNEIEKNAIAAHMFPLNTTLPRYKESWLLTLVDKGVAIYEYSANKFSYRKVTSKVGYACSLLAIMAYYLLTKEMR